MRDVARSDDEYSVQARDCGRSIRSSSPRAPSRFDSTRLRVVLLGTALRRRGGCSLLECVGVDSASEADSSGRGLRGLAAGLSPNVCGPRRLALRCSRRLRDLPAPEAVTARLLVRENLRRGRSAGGCSIGRVAGDDTIGDVSGLLSRSEMQRSVMLRHRLSTLRRTWRSFATPIAVDGAALPVSAASCRASATTASRLWKTFDERLSLDLASASWSKGWMWDHALPTSLCCSIAGGAGVSMGASAGSGLRDCLGDELIVVGAVVAVRGRSLEPEAAALDVEGFLSLDSSFLMRDFSSSSSSHTVSAACESTDESGPC